MIKLTALIAIFASQWLIMISAVQAQPYPSKPIRIIVDGPPGGINDIWARRYAQRMGESIATSIVVENRTGASGTIAAEALTKAAPDGYTLLYGGMTPLVTFPSAGGATRYDPTKDIESVALGTLGYPILVTSAASGIKSVAELIAKAKSSPEELTCGTAGQASIQHFACANLAKNLGIKVRVIPYKSGYASMIDTAAGQIQLSIGYSSETEPLVTQGRLTSLAVFAPNRLPKFAGTQTFAEAGFAGMEMPSFAGFFLPANTSKAIVERLNTEVLSAIARPEMAEFIKSAGAFYLPLKASEFSEFMRKEQSKWKRMSEETGIRNEQ
jgi:tripartite-type tricarboxylate transporter receptor subunit TctC